MDCPKKPPSEPSSPIRLRRVMSSLDCTCYIVCVIIGSGIFVSPAGVLAHAGSPAAALGVWVAGGVFSMLEAMCFAELVLTFPRLGSTYTYLVEGFGGVAGWLFVWVECLFVDPACSAIASLTFASYFCGIFFCEPPAGLKQIIAAIALTLVTVMQCFSTKIAVHSSNVLTAAKMLGLVIIVVSGVVWMASGLADHNLSAWQMTGATTDDPAELVLAFHSAYYAYKGMEGAMNVVEELRPPLIRNMLVGITAAMAIVVSVYVMANVAYLAVLGKTGILASEAVAMSLGAEVVSGRWLSGLMSLFVACSTFGTMSNGVMICSRMGLAATRHGHLPRPASLICSSFLTPVPMLLFNVSLGLVLLSTNSIYDLMLYTTYMGLIATAGSVVVLVMLRFRRPDLHRPLKLPLFIPVSYLAAFCVLLVFPFYSSPESTLLCLAFLLSGLPVYFLVVCPRSWVPVAWLKRAEAEATHFMQKLFMALPEEYAKESEMNNDTTEQNGHCTNGKVPL